jgi:hypothetical protein
VAVVAAHQLRRRWAGIGAVLVFSVFGAGILGTLAIRMKEHEAVLDLRGRETSAVVVESNERVVRQRPDNVDVRFEVGGRQYTPRLPVVDSADFPVGSEVQVVYDPENPHHAKPTEGWSPSYEDVSLMAWIGLGLGTLHSARRILRTLLLLGTVRQPRYTTTMRAESFAITRWWQRFPRHWAALWPIDANPLVDDVELYVPIEEIGGRASLGVHASSLVLGMAQPQQLLVIIQGETVVWPRGRATRDEPAGNLDAIR